MVVVFGCGFVGFWPLWCANARLLGDACAWYGRARYGLSSGCFDYCGADRIVQTLAFVGRRLFGISIYLFGRDISHNGDDAVGASANDALSLHLLYGVVYRPGGQRSGVVVLSVQGGGDVALLLVAIVGFGATEKGVG